mmetsp:Transcript_58141/g.182494  ORF Transcript_58141/g.182494 Transcript_58141/m.182494 type:complete len:268 (-) Transcript_58141:203-1006(-)
MHHVCVGKTREKCREALHALEPLRKARGVLRHPTQELLDDVRPLADLDEIHRERPDVSGKRIVALATHVSLLLQHLGRDEGQRATALRQALRGAAEHSCQAEILQADLLAALRDDEGAGLDVPVADCHAMQVRHSSRHLRHEAVGDGSLQCTATSPSDLHLDVLVQVHAARVLHHQVQVLRPVQRRSSPEHVRVRGQVLHEAGLLLQGEHLGHLPEAALADHLHGDCGTRAVGRLVDLAVRTLAEALHEGVLANADARAIRIELLLQ